MGSSSHNPPAPGGGIAPKEDPKSAEPPFNQAARGEAQAKPEVLQHNLNLTPPHYAPDGSVIVRGRAEDTRQQGIEGRFQRVEAQRENDGGQQRDALDLNRDFHDSRDNRR